MTEVRQQRAAVRKQRARVSRPDAKCFLSALCASAVNPIFDLRLLISVLCVLLFALCASADAQQQAKLPKIGWLAVRPASAAFAIESFQREFSKLGYIDGKNIAFEYRYAEGKLDRLPALADELVRLKVDLIIAPNTPAAVAAKNATKTIPIVFIDVTDPIAAGLVDSLPRPGGNITGLLPLVRYWPANVSSCSRKLFPIFPVLPCCGIRRIQARRRVGKKANCRRENSACNFIPWK